MAIAIKLIGRLIFRADIRAVTGLHIGGSPAGLNIGGLDNPVIRDPKTRRPYIPGSSLKGKMRSLLERARGFDAGDGNRVQEIGRVRIHSCQREREYVTCDVCPLFGLPGDRNHSTPTRLIVRDTLLDPASLKDAQTDFPFTEIKWETPIDRITAKAVPRQIERVPAGAVFAGAELVLSIYAEGNSYAADVRRVAALVEAMQLLEDDYLGGLGSRGSGKIAFRNIAVDLRQGSRTTPYAEGERFADLAALIAAQSTLMTWTTDRLTAGAGNGGVDSGSDSGEADAGAGSGGAG